MKKLTAVLLALALCVSFAACSKSNEGTKSKTEGDSKVWYFNNENEDVEAMFGGFKDTINPQDVYSSIEYTEDMLYGSYAVNNLENDIKDLKEKLSFSDVTFDNGTFNISSLPVKVYSGTEYLDTAEYAFQAVNDREVASLGFIVGDEIGTVPCTYEINGNKIKYTVLTETTPEGGDFSYDLFDVTFEYEFKLNGPNLTLSDGKDSVTLTAFTFSENNTGSMTMIRGYSAEKTALIDNLACFVSEQDGFINFALDRSGNYYRDSACKLTDDGRFTIYLTKKDDNGEEVEIIKQFAYIAQCSNLAALNSFSVILFDGEKTYYYNDTDTSREERLLEEDGVDVDSLDEDDIKEIAEKKSDLYDDLTKEFSEKGISASINRSTGEIVMDANVLFGGDSAEITADGKALLDKFVEAYTSVIFNEKYKDFVSKTVVEGHIAPVSGVTYESGLPFSEKRAKNVMDYCVKAEPKLENNITAVGLSNSKPIYDANGKIDFDASRRVSFKCIVNVKE